MVGGGGVRLAPESCVWQGEFFVALDARHDERNPRREAVVRVASAIEVEWLEELFPQSVRREQSATFDEARGKVVGLRQTFYRDLLIAETKDAAVGPAACRAGAGRGAAAAGAGDLRGGRVGRQRARPRRRCSARHMPEHPWPAFDDAELGEILAEAAAGKRRPRRAAPHAAGPACCSRRLPYPLDRLLEQHAPESLEVPTGNRIKLDYSAGPSPCSPSGCRNCSAGPTRPASPTAGCPCVLHLLGPNYRPVQITDDLRSFWSTTYFQVRKDLRVRYPKHSWPEDPLTATPVAKGRSTRR